MASRKNKADILSQLDSTFDQLFSDTEPQAEFESSNSTSAERVSPKSSVSPINNDKNKMRRKSPRRTIDPKLLIPNELNKFNVDTNGSDFKELVELIKRDGILHPILCKENSRNDGTYDVISGHRRRLAALELGMNKVPYEVIMDQLSPAEEIALIARANEGSRQNNPFDMAKQLKIFIEALKKENITETKELCKEACEGFNISERSYYNYESLSRLDDNVLQWGAMSLITRDDGIFLSQKLSNSSYHELALKTISRMSEIEKSGADNVSTLFTAELNALKKATTKKPVKEKRRPSSYAIVKKIAKVTTDTDYTIPNKPEQKENMLEMINQTMEFLEKLAGKLK